VEKWWRDPFLITARFNLSLESTLHLFLSIMDELIMHF